MCRIHFLHLYTLPLICYDRFKTMFIEVKRISPSCKPCMHVIGSISELACMRIWIIMHAWVSATRARSQHCPWCRVAGSETNILPAFTTRNMRERREGVEHVSLRARLVEMFMCACHRPTEAARFRVQKCANNHQLIVAGVERFLWHACAAHFRVIHTRKTPCALRIYTQTLIGVFFVHGNAHTHACLTGGWNLFYFDGRHL